MFSFSSLPEDSSASNSFYITLFENNVIPELAEITVIDMEGWKLLECHLLSPNAILHLGWDKNAATPEWIETNDCKYYQYYPHLSQGLVKSFTTNDTFHN